MSITISDVEPRVQYTATAGQTSFTVGFEFFDNADLKVFNGTSLLTFSASPTNASQYSVSGAGQTGGGSITLGSPGATLNDIITISRDLAIARSTDFPTSGAFQIGSLNTELDKIIAMCQQLERDLKFSPRAAATTANTFDITFPNLEANKILAVNTSGTGLQFTQTIGNFKGNWSASTSYVQRDIVKDTSTNNIFIANTDHTSSGSQPLTTNTDSSKWDLLVDAASATTSATNAANSATAASTSASNASTSETNAATSASTATTQATNAATSATAAQAAQTAAELAADNFDDTYLGAKASDPTVDNDGNALAAGMLYFNSTNDILRVYSGSAWQDAAISSTGVVTLTGTQTLTNKTLTAPKINENVAVTSTATELNILDGATVVVGEVNALDLGGTGTGTAIASKAVVLDGNKDYTGIRNVSLTGTLGVTGISSFAVAANVAQASLTSSSNAVAWDASAKPNAVHVTTENTTFSAPTNNVEGAFIALEINYNGSHTIAFNTIFEFAASTAPTFTSTNGKTDILVFRYNGAVWQEVGRTLNLSES
jgi:uncharacterized membrane protein